ncbi:MAG: HRDC domain-containing protein [Prevotella sp.]|nr:HRDC domain-containing protein [Prevotella sp.]
MQTGNIQSENPQPSKIHMSEEALLALKIIETTGCNLFLTGKAGTGKTTLLRYLKHNISKRNVVLAPTGIAAINAEGVTLHSFFQLPFAPFIPDSSFQQNGRYQFSKQKIKILRSLDLIVIDEISMVRADLLDAVDSVLRHYRRNTKPFGGVQLLLIGDLGQLAPVAKDEEWTLLSRYYDTPYFFSSHALRQTPYSVVELTHVYRQQDQLFVDLLNKVRDNAADANVLRALNSRYIPNFQPREEEGYIRLTTHNALAQAINNEELTKLPGQTVTFKAEVEGKFPELSYPTDEVLELKLNAQVMFVKNDSSPEKRYYNGMIGRVSAIHASGFSVIPKDSTQAIEVNREEWENNRYELDENTREIKEVTEGLFRQYPVKTAWAITIHKSQGLTFSHAIIDAAASFAHGQTYVALSRCKNLDGLVLSTPIPAHAIIRDASVDAFNAFAASRQPDNAAISTMQRAYYLQQVADLFDFSDVSTAFYSAMRLVNEHYGKTFPRLALEYKARNAFIIKEVIEVAKTFSQQYTAIIGSEPDYTTSPLLQERIQKGATYFLKKLEEAAALVSSTSLQTDNKEVKKRTADNFNTLVEVLQMKQRMLSFVIKQGFTLPTYLRAKAMAAIDEADKVTTTRSTKATRSTKSTGSKTPATGANPFSDAPISEQDIAHPVLYNKLRQWRKETADEEGIPAFMVMHTKVLIAISNEAPTTTRELAAVKGFGPKKTQKYGEAVLNIINRCGKR